MKLTTLFAGATSSVYGIVTLIQGVWEWPSRQGAFFLTLTVLTLLALLIEAVRFWRRTRKQ